MMQASLLTGLCRPQMGVELVSLLKLGRGLSPVAFAQERYRKLEAVKTVVQSTRQACLVRRYPSFLQ
jgi:hypothetical protein